MANIDIGSVATNRESNEDGNKTYIDLANPANISGKIDTVAIYCHGTYNPASVKIATFFNVSGNNYTARSVSAIINPVVGYSTYAIDIDVVAGDYIGIYFTDEADYIKSDTSGGSGLLELAGDQTACVDATFTLNAGYAISVYGTGVRVVSLSGGLTFQGTLSSAKIYVQALVGAVTFIGTLTTAHIFVRVLSGAITFTGTLVKKTGISLSGAITFTSAFSKKQFIALSGTLTFVGKLFGNVLWRKITKAISTYTKISKAISTYTKRDKAKGEEL